jgi:hypothetical protein
VVPVPILSVWPVELPDGAPVVPGPELGAVVDGDALPLGLVSGLDAVLRDDVQAAARDTNSASAERPAMTDFIRRSSCGDV